MISISKSLPVQFWLNGKPVYNEQTQFEVMEDHFHQLWTSTDNVVLQFLTTEDIPLYVRIMSDANVMLEEIPMVKTTVEGGYLHYLSFQFATYEITDQIVSLKILTKRTEIEVTLTDTMETGTAEMTFTADLFLITAELTDTMETGVAEIVNEGIVVPVYEHLVRLSDDPEMVCSAGETTVYSLDEDLAEGSIIYTDEPLTTPVSGYDYVAFDGLVYNLDDPSGEIGTFYGFCIAP